MPHCGMIPLLLAIQFIGIFPTIEGTMQNEVSIHDILENARVMLKNSGDINSDTGDHDGDVYEDDDADEDDEDDDDDEYEDDDDADDDDYDYEDVDDYGPNDDGDGDDYVDYNDNDSGVDHENSIDGSGDGEGISDTTVASSRLAPRPHGIFEDIMGSLHDVMTSIGEMAAGNMMNLSTKSSKPLFIQNEKEKLSILHMPSHNHDDHDDNDVDDNQYNDSEEGPPFKSSKKKYTWEKNPQKCEGNKNCKKRMGWCNNRCNSNKVRGLCSKSDLEGRKRHCERKRHGYSCGKCKQFTCEDCKRWEKEMTLKVGKRKEQIEYGCPKLCDDETYDTKRHDCRWSDCCRADYCPCRYPANKCGILSCGIGEQIIGGRDKCGLPRD